MGRNVSANGHTNSRKLLNFQDQLIEGVKKHKILYDAEFKAVHSMDMKYKTWKQIGLSLNSDVEHCKNVWTSLRESYQQKVRDNYKYYKHRISETKKGRPVILFEGKLQFLRRFVTRSRCIPKKSKQATECSHHGNNNSADILLSDDEEPVIILDGNDNKTPSINTEHMTVTTTMQKLIDIIQQYPEIYDTKNEHYTNFYRRGAIWNALANELKEKATKLMKMWIHIQTRFEWELNHMEIITDLQKMLCFLKPHILLNANTVYKQSHFLKYNWEEPIDNFKDIFHMLATLWKFPNIINYTESELLCIPKKTEYMTAWNVISATKGLSPGKCESTWLLLRYFYWELILMRRNSYQLQDKWYFENVIKDLYKNAIPAPAMPDSTENPTTIKLGKGSRETDKKLEADLAHEKKMQHKNSNDISVSSKLNTSKNNNEISRNNFESNRRTLENEIKNGNEVTIKLVSTNKGNRLVIHSTIGDIGYMICMQTITDFFAHITGVHNKFDELSKSLKVMDNRCFFMSQKFCLPVHICKAILIFLSKNVRFFNKREHADELRTPYESKIFSWTECTDLFGALDVDTEFIKHKPAYYIPRMNTANLQKRKVYYDLIDYVRKFPKFLQIPGSEKKCIFERVAASINYSVLDCEICFQRAVWDYRLYKRCDVNGKCRINCKLFTNIAEIYSSINLRKKLNIKTPTELNLSVVRERIPTKTSIPSVNVCSSNPSTLLMCWTYVIGNLPLSEENAAEKRLLSVFKKYNKTT